MLQKTFIVLSIFFGISLASPVLSQSETTNGTITGGAFYQIPGWFKESFLEIADDVIEANDSGKQVILFFHLDGCPYCQRTLEENFTHGPTKDFIQQHFDVIALNIRGDREIALNEDQSATEKELANTLKIQYTPTIVFLNSDNKPVLRLNGYRSPPAVKMALDYVSGHHYQQQSFSEYKRNNMKYAQYKLLDDPLFKKTTDLSVLDGPVAVIFEDDDCNECTRFHEKLLKRPEIRALLKRYTVLRLDAKSTAQMTDFDGKKTSARQFSEQLKMTYRPGVVLFDEGEEVARIESLLYPFHFQMVLRYGLDKNHELYPNYLALSRVIQEKMLAEGKNVHVGKPTDW